MDEEEKQLFEDFGLEAPEEEALEAPTTEETTEVPVQEQETGQEGGAEGPAETPPLPSPAAPVPPSPQGEGNGMEAAVPPTGPQGGDLEAAGRAAEDEAYRAAFAGRMNPYTGQPIASKADFEAYQAQLQADRQEQQMEALRQAGVTPEAIQAIVSQHPVVQQAQQVIQQVQAERERAQAERAKGWFGEQLQQINALDPEAKVDSLDALAARDPAGYQQMLGMVGRGVSLVDAYKMAHFDELAAKRAGAAKQAVLNHTAGKAHLAPAGGQGKAGVEVPGDVKAMYRELNPDMTDEQIRTEYAKYLKETM